MGYLSEPHSNRATYNCSNRGKSFVRRGVCESDDLKQLADDAPSRLIVIRAVLHLELAGRELSMTSSTSEAVWMVGLTIYIGTRSIPSTKLIVIDPVHFRHDENQLT
ncbi:hypothetical protein PsorP6_011198 [Peronosclerospora sorghi]|uniref:Uncharacterized protein n=1 Tax=Peronosclerospora sorghi TaxID=230839 RepID=A0ACC0VXI8_9STRA|nr:hypothetical protein PsorP6_011198 [Peronosclerospora sorghi]